MLHIILRLVPKSLGKYVIFLFTHSANLPEHMHLFEHVFTSRYFDK